jgi:glutaredoxin 3
LLPKKEVMLMALTIYTTPTCPWCKKTKAFLKSKKISFTEQNVADNTAARNSMLKKSGQLGVPVLDIGGKIIVGYDPEGILSAIAKAGKRPTKKKAAKKATTKKKASKKAPAKKNSKVKKVPTRASPKRRATKNGATKRKKKVQAKKIKHLKAPPKRHKKVAVKKPASKPKRKATTPKKVAKPKKRGFFGLFR